MSVPFSYYNIKFKKHPVESCILVTGDARNESEKSFNTAAFRVKLFIGQEATGSCIVKIPGFKKKSTRPFEVLIESMHHALIPKISKCEIIFETAF